MNDDAASPELAAADAAARPRVALPPGGVPTWALVIAALALGLAVLLLLNGRRNGNPPSPTTRNYAPPATPALPPALLQAPATPISSHDTDAVRATPLPFAEPPPPFAAPIPRSNAAPPNRPEINGELGEAAGHVTFRTQPPPGAPQPGGTQMRGGSAVVYDGGTTPNTADDRPSTTDGSVRARLMRNRPAVVAQGEVLAATLETPVSSIRPGPIRAVIARDVRGFDGSRILIPRGSRLIGEYRADPVPGRRRVLATWTRLIRPDGVAIRIDSPASDALGGTGMPGKVDTHFLARFANAALQSALQIGVNLASRSGNGAVIITGPSQLSTVMGPTIIPGADQPPTVSVPAGAAIAVFVARDLDFSGVPVVR